MIESQKRMESTVIFPEITFIDEEIELLNHLFAGILFYFWF